MHHATVKIDNMIIPLIGIPPEATEYECDLCHERFAGIENVTISENGRQILCLKHSDAPPRMLSTL